ncbi:MAG: hypothetical protein ACI8S6_002767 [Myxococcota bacterium]
MSLATQLLLAVELSGPLDRGAVSASETTLQLFAAETARLPVYRGPLLQPEVSVQRGALWVGLAPAVHLSADGDVSVRQAALSLRPRYQGDVLLLGVDIGGSVGRALRDGERIAAAPPSLSISPTIGARTPLGEQERAYISGRAGWNIIAEDAHWSQSLSGALSFSWRL